MIDERTVVKGAGAGVYNITPDVSDIPDRFKVTGPNGLQLLVLGGIEDPRHWMLMPRKCFDQDFTI